MQRTGFALLVLLAVAGLPAAAEEATLEEVLDGYYETIGGLDAWKEVQTVRMTGNMKMGQGMEAPFTMTFQRPGMSRLEFTLQGMTGIQAYDGEQAWYVMPFMGKTDPEPMPEEQAEQAKEQSDLDGPLVDFEEKGIQVELVGKEEIEGTGAYKLKVTMENGDVRHYYLDDEYHLPFFTLSKTEIQGQEVEIETRIGDYKEVGGLVMAHSVNNRPKGAGEDQGQTIIIDSAELGVEVPGDFFTMPEVAAAAAAEGS